MKKVENCCSKSLRLNTYIYPGELIVNSSVRTKHPHLNDKSTESEHVGLDKSVSQYNLQIKSPHQVILKYVHCFYEHSTVFSASSKYCDISLGATPRAADSQT